MCCVLNCFGGSLSFSSSTSSSPTASTVLSSSSHVHVRRRDCYGSMRVSEMEAERDKKQKEKAVR